MDTATWEEIRAEYRAALAAERAATDRANRAGQALVAAQCGVHYGTTTDADGKVWRQFCTLPKMHTVATGHGKDPIERGADRDA